MDEECIKLVQEFIRNVGADSWPRTLLHDEHGSFYVHNSPGYGIYIDEDTVIGYGNEKPQEQAIETYIVHCTCPNCCQWNDVEMSKGRTIAESRQLCTKCGCCEWDK